jgi:uncharacterized protein
MNAMKWMMTIAAAAACLTTNTAKAGADEDLRQAAGLHRQGRTAQAITIWRGWAERGDVDAAYNLGVIHHYGDGVAKDTREALKWYRHAAERGDKVSHYQVGLIYQTGDGVPADAVEAQRWFVAPRQHHAHHQHDPKLEKWRKEAAELIWKRDMRESLAASRQNGATVVAELQRRAATVAVAGDTPRVAMAGPVNTGN